MNAFDLVTTAAAQLFSERNVSAADEYFADSYIQHSALAEDGIAGLKALVNNLPENFHYEPARVIADGTHVVLHGTYYGFGDAPLVAFDIFRVEEGKIVEHWDALAPEVEHTVSGNSQTDGAKEVSMRPRPQPTSSSSRTSSIRCSSARTTPCSPTSSPPSPTSSTTRMPTMAWPVSVRPRRSGARGQGAGL